jgi:hypothetical protein
MSVRDRDCLEDCKHKAQAVVERFARPIVEQELVRLKQLQAGASAKKVISLKSD